MQHRTARAGGLLLAAVFASACATPVGIYPKNAREVHEDLTRSVLSSEQLSPYTRHVLVRTGQLQNHASSPDETLSALGEGLRQGVAYEFSADRLFALAELSYLRAQRSWLHPRAQRAHYLAAAVYAWAFLFPGDGAGPDPFDPRLRIASDLYNRAVAEALTDPETRRIELRDGVHEVLEGSLQIDFDEATLAWAGYELTDFRDAAKLGVRGILNRYRLPGVGAPLVASTRRTSEAREAGDALVPSYIKVPVTALLRFDDVRGALREGRNLSAHLELYASDASASIEIDGREVPLEYEGSSAFADTLSNELIWDFELKGFFQGDFIPFSEQTANEGLFLLHPYVPGRIPIVFVHGTASSAGRWADLVNELLSISGYRERFQPWLFTYNTGQPIAYSASLLREALHRAVGELDPEGSDPALRRMVVIGHSQGGMLTRLMVTSSGDRFWNAVSERRLDELDLDTEVRELLRESLFFEPLPFVDRVVFLCTPHRGSYLATWDLSYWLRRFIRLPTTVTGAVGQLIARNPEALAMRSLSAVPNSLDNMTPDHPFVRTLSASPIAPGVHVHSIIAVKTNGPVEEGNDGVVEYRSAHLEGVESEKVVHSGHSAQSNPDTILEVGRILLEHMREAP